MPESAESAADNYPPNRLAAGYFPTSTGGDPNRLDGGPVKADGLTPITVIRLPVPGPARLVVRLFLAVLRTLVGAPPAVGASYDLTFAIHRDSPTNPSVVNATTTTIADADGAYAVTPVLNADGSIDFQFTGLIGETYNVTGSLWVLGATPTP